MKRSKPDPPGIEPTRAHDAAKRVKAEISTEPQPEWEAKRARVPRIPPTRTPLEPPEWKVTQAQALHIPRPVARTPQEPPEWKVKREQGPLEPPTRLPQEWEVKRAQAPQEIRPPPTRSHTQPEEWEVRRAQMPLIPPTRSHPHQDPPQEEWEVRRAQVPLIVPPTRCPQPAQQEEESWKAKRAQAPQIPPPTQRPQQKPPTQRPQQKREVKRAKMRQKLPTLSQEAESVFARIKHPPYVDMAAKHALKDVPTIMYPLHSGEVIPSPTRSPVESHFPGLLLHILDRAEIDGYADIFSWQPHGRAFKVHDRALFEKVIMANFFLGRCQITSFYRQLCAYGFYSIIRFDSPDKGAYFHPSFLRGRPDLLKNLSRSQLKGTGKRRAVDPQTEPDLSLYPPLPPVPNYQED